MANIYVQHSSHQKAGKTFFECILVREDDTFVTFKGAFHQIFVISFEGLQSQCFIKVGLKCIGCKIGIRLTQSLSKVDNTILFGSEGSIIRGWPFVSVSRPL